MSGHVFDPDNWKLEAEVVINDVKDHVKTLEISEKLGSDYNVIYLNLITNEGNNYCIQLSAQGFRVVGYESDVNDLDSEVYFETPYSLLNSVSPSFKVSFANALFKKLNELN